MNLNNVYVSHAIIAHFSVALAFTLIALAMIVRIH